jgi:hypothetical protein
MRQVHKQGSKIAKPDSCRCTLQGAAASSPAFQESITHAQLALHVQ